jgi:transposase-like protein
MYSSKSRSGRRRWTTKQRQRLLARFHESQLTQRDFANRHGDGLSTLSKWLRVESEAASPSVKFQEMTLTNIPPRYAVEVVSPQG